MRKLRSISDGEISLIKAMLKQGMPHKDIQFFFNRPNRPVNSGRISGIRNGSYSNSGSIIASTEAELDSFLSSYKQSPIDGISISFQNGILVREHDPISDDTLKSMFKDDGSGVFRFIHGESIRHECKESFNIKSSDRWMRAIAALANNCGGYIVFGVRDKTMVDEKMSDDSFELVGLNNSNFEGTDIVEFTKRLKSTFDPTPMIDQRCLTINTKKVGFLYVHQHTARPIIATKNDGDLIREGDIYFRYPGQSSRIKYSDLRSLLDERDREAREGILPMLQKLLSLGPRNSMVADLDSGTLGDENTTIVIGEDLLERFKFIKEGDFSEKMGSETLKLIGNVQATNFQTGTIVKGFVTSLDVIRDFIQQNPPANPTEYIRFAVEASGGAWLPMHYFAGLAKMDKPALIRFISKSGASNNTKNLYIGRVKDTDSAYEKLTQKGKLILERIKKHEVPSSNNTTEANAIARSISGILEKTEADVSSLLTILENCAKKISEDNSASLSCVRKALARIDQLYFLT